jgi:phosphotransferase family enzyme
MLGLEPSLVIRIEALLGDRLVAAQPAGGGYSSARRWLVTGRGGRTAFAKIGATPVSDASLRREAAVYERLVLPSMPEVYGWDADSPPILLLSDLSRNEWPPPWTAERIDRVLQVIDSVHSASAALPPYSEVQDADEDWWGRVAAAPEPFLRLDVVRPDWLQRNVDSLAASARTVSCAGSSVTHYDLRSDNLCFSSTHTYLVDWSHACLGNPRLDLALFLPSLASEGGPPPETILPADPAAAAWVAGFFAWHASKPHIPTAPTVRTMQRRLLVSALPWATRELDLEPLGD